MEVPKFFTRIIEGALTPPSPDDIRAIKAGNQLFADQQRGLLDPEQFQERLKLLEKSGVNTQRALAQFSSLQATQDNLIIRP